MEPKAKLRTIPRPLHSANMATGNLGKSIVVCGFLGSGSGEEELEYVGGDEGGKCREQESLAGKDISVVSPIEM